MRNPHISFLFFNYELNEIKKDDVNNSNIYYTPHMIWYDSIFLYIDVNHLYKKLLVGRIYFKKKKIIFFLVVSSLLCSLVFYLYLKSTLVVCLFPYKVCASTCKLYLKCPFLTTFDSSKDIIPSKAHWEEWVSTLPFSWKW